MNVNEFPKTLAAARALTVNSTRDQWALGDALIEECGKPGPDGVNNGSTEKLSEAVAALKADGLDYAEITLRKFRDISHAYSPDRRLSGVGWWVHAAVPNPDMLDVIVASLPKGETLTVAKAEERVGMIRAENERNYNAEQDKQDAKRAEEHKAAKEEEAAAKARAEEAARKAREANSERARRAAEKEQAKAREEAKEAARRKRASAPTPITPEIRNKAPDPKRMSGIELSASLLGTAEEAKKQASKAKQLIDQHGDELSDTAVAAFAESALQTHQAWLDLANAVRRGRNPRAHLAVVGDD